MLLIHRLKMNHPKEVSVLRQEPKVSVLIEELTSDGGSEGNAPETEGEKKDGAKDEDPEDKIF